MSRVVGGFPVGPDNRVHPILTHNPSTLRFSCVDPNLQNLPRGMDAVPEQRWVKEMFVAPKGWVFFESDFSGIEAVLVGYFAGSPRYIRAAKLGVHAFLASHLVDSPADWSWDDQRLKAHFKEVKRNKAMYDTAKRIVHGSNYMMTPHKMAYEYPETFKTVKEAAHLQGLYHELFPEIRLWHRALCDRVDGTKKRNREDVEVVDPWTLGVCHARNPFGYVHRFYNVLDWQKVEIEGKVEWISTFGEDAKRLVAFLPQSTAAGILKRAIRTLWYEYPWVGQHLRLVIHDAIFGECPESEVEECLRTTETVMTMPVPELPLDPAWGMGEYLTIGVESKVGSSWGTMH